MKNKGFTLVELLAVIVLLGVITIIGSAGINGIKKSINNNMLKSTINLIEKQAILYGEDHEIAFKESDSCAIKNKYCKKVQVNILIKRGYIKTNETRLLSNGKEEKVLIDNTKEKGAAGYYLNEKYVYIYKENNAFYAKFDINS